MKSPASGAIGITFCPGKKQANAMTGAWNRDLDIDMKAVKEWGATLVITLITQDEMAILGVEEIETVALANGLDWLHMPIDDYSIPDEQWNTNWQNSWHSHIHEVLDSGDKLLVHCKGGLGRAGAIAAKILTERGFEGEKAIELVRKARHGAIETKGQEDFVIKNKLFHNPPKKDRARGAMLGLMIGDALGTTLEFSARDANPHHTEIIGGGPFSLPKGAYTDDTAMALALAGSIATKGELDEQHLMGCFVNWWRNGAYSSGLGCFDIGITTRDALARFEKTGNPIAGSTSPSSAGNGSLMRLSPVAVRWHGDIEIAMEMARRQSATTHGAPECLDACEYFASLLVKAINGETKEDVLAPIIWHGEPAITEIASGGWHAKTRNDIKSTGYVIDSIEAAIWCVANSDSFEEALILAVNLGGDADTIGAITGQLAGAIWGTRAIPPRWVDGLETRDAELHALFESIYSAGG
ncbi:MAG: ADP-ribosylglycohydrolase, partial [Hyphomonadaceae bacterium]